MGDVRRYARDGEPDSIGALIEFSDYARLERERDTLLFAKTRLDQQHNEDSRRICEQADELTRLRAVEAAANTLLDKTGYRGSRAHIVVPTAAQMSALAEACGRKGNV